MFRHTNYIRAAILVVVTFRLLDYTSKRVLTCAFG